MVRLQFIQILILASLASMALSCSQPQGWKIKTMMERIEDSKLLIFGKVGPRTNATRASGSGLDVTYEIDVYCVLKKDTSISRNIGPKLDIHTIEPSAECVSNAAGMSRNRRIIVMLREDGNMFKFHNINVQSAVFEGSDVNLEKITDSCHAIQLYEPTTASYTTKCPKVDEERKKSCNSGAFLGYAMKVLVFCISMVLFVNKSL